MMGGDERFYAWLDGELSGEEAAAMEARVASDPELSQLAREDRALKARLVGAFGTVSEAPVPKRLLDAARSPESSNIVDLPAHRTQRQRSRAGVPQWMAMAASLGVGVLVGSTALGPSRTDNVTERAGVLYAAAALENGLDTQLASAPGDHPIRIGITYRDRSGQFCRTFTATGSSGLACRDQGRWQVRAMLSSSGESSGDFRMASGIDPALVDLIAHDMAGQPLDATAERAALQSGWSR